MRAQNKISLRLFKKHAMRLITIIAIVVVSVGFMSGVGEVKNKIGAAVCEQYHEYNMSDLYVKSKKVSGFSFEELQYFEDKFGTERLEKLFSYEIEFDFGVVRIYNLNLNDNKINELEILEGRFPESSDELVVERKTEDIIAYAIGDKISLSGQEYTVCGVVYNPLMTITLNEPSFSFNKENGDAESLAAVYYIHGDAPIIVNDVYITLSNRDLFDTFSTEYEREIEKIKNETESALGIDNVSVLSLYENKGLYSLYSYSVKVGQIGVIFVVFFLLVTILVVYSTMKRLFDEERAQTACQKTLGFSDSKIINRYVFFVFMGTLIGGLLAFPVGFGLTQILYTAFNIQYRMLPLPITLNFSYYGITLLIVILGTVITTFISGRTSVSPKPVVLLKPKAPKVGKKTFLEYIPVVWKRLSFKYKSTLRNVFLFKSRFFMTVISVAGSAVLLFAGLGLMDNALKIDGASSLITISIALVAFSAALCALVIYNITNINVSERYREIATLMVLGYQDREVTGYIFREIYIMCAIAALIGLPVGALFVNFVFNFIDFGSLSNINWWTYVSTPCIMMFFSFISTRLLWKKITLIDMNASLKSLE